MFMHSFNNCSLDGFLGEGFRLGLLRASNGELAKVGQGWGDNREPQGSSCRRSNVTQGAYWDIHLMP